jgi:hypothetical protein
MRKQQGAHITKKVKPLKHRVGAVHKRLHALAQIYPHASVPGVAPAPECARIPYRKNPLSENEALNLICDARRDEATYPLGKLLKTFKHGTADP